jgi:hypothetical protein
MTPSSSNAAFMLDGSSAGASVARIVTLIGRRYFFANSKSR